MLLQPTANRHFEDFRHVEPKHLALTSTTTSSTPTPSSLITSLPYFERRTLPLTIMRAGTSKGLFINAAHLPASRSSWQHILPAIMGSPDPYSRQLDGLGGGTSTTSKIAVVSLSSAPSIADVDYLFVQCPLDSDVLDFTGNCGNILSGVGPYAFEEGLVPKSVLAPLRPGFTSSSSTSMKGGVGEERVALTLRCLNNGQLIRSTFAVSNGKPVEYGDVRIDGVGRGGGSGIQLDFLDPAGSMCGSLCPTGKAVDLLKVEGEDLPLEVSCVDAANPFVFVRMSDIDESLTGGEPASVLARYGDRVERIRQAAAVLMGLAPTTKAAAMTKGTPKICLLSPPVPAGGSDTHITARSFSMGNPHPALQLSGAVCLAAACYIPNSIASQIMLQGGKRRIMPEKLRIGHACGRIEATADVEMDPKREVGVHVRSTSLFRTARRLASGEAYYLAPTQ
ncbi:uncharacterized protein SPSC_01211 [Sporisorium scitamineum]|uniref:Uncharacterized protein n=2 Tax=Sporisorium scitamineum TaxID=49012 RepID=A0A127Z8V3_9BASI|nr:uncharacterized protein SPSC_01211 [Sporisorium scitamineum]